jgi:porin
MSHLLRHTNHRLAAAFAIVAACALSQSTPGRAEPTEKTGIPDDSIAKSLPSNGDPVGYRKALAGSGVTYGITAINEGWANTEGGLRRGFAGNGRIELFTDADLETLAGAKGLTFHANAFWIYGGNIGREFAGNLFVISNIEAVRTFRLSELWLEQKVEKVSVRVGQLAADTEFATSAFAGLFPGSTFGWPGEFAADLPSGGPAYPFATPGVRVKYEPNATWTVLAGVFNGDPAGQGNITPQRLNRYGTSFRVSDPPLVMGEVQYKLNQEKTDTGLATTVKLGGLYHFGRFDDQRFTGDGVPRAIANAKRFDGDYSVYAVVDQQLYRPAGAAADKGIGVFARIMGSPGDRNLLDFYVDGGFTFAGLIPSRPNDSFGIAAAYGRISDNARDADRDAIALSGAGLVRDYEALVEVTYQAQIADGFIIQPDLQYVWHPGGNVSVNGRDAVKDALVVGLRSVIKY